MSETVKPVAWIEPNTLRALAACREGSALLSAIRTEDETVPLYDESALTTERAAREAAEADVNALDQQRRRLQQELDMASELLAERRLRAEAAEAEVARLREGIERLAATWVWADEGDHCADELRRLLDNAERGKGE